MPQLSISSIEILHKLLTQKFLTANEWQILAQESRVIAADIHPENLSTHIKNRADIFLAIYPQIFRLRKESDTILETLWNLWIPLAINLVNHKTQLKRSLIQGILGIQGTGKSTLASILRLILNHLGCNALCLSIDDLYKPYHERLKLKLEDPRLIWRGPPGTHDINTGLEVLNQLIHAHTGEQISVPRFDKSLWDGAGDRIQPEIVENIDIVLFEGWFVGVRPIDTIKFDAAPFPIVTSEDCQFARDTNQRLKDYLPLWEKLDRLMVLYPLDYRFSQQWRQQAEDDMIATGKSGMTDTEICQFVNYFWKALHPELFIKPLITNSNLVNLVIEINQDHSVANVYQFKD